MLPLSCAFQLPEFTFKGRPGVSQLRGERKACLRELFDLRQDAATKGKVEELIDDLISVNPTKCPTSSRKLSGTWRLAWATNTASPLWKPGNILGGYSQQVIFDGNTRIRNSVLWDGVGLELGGEAELEVQSGVRLGVTIDSFSLGMPGRGWELPLFIGGPPLVVMDGAGGQARTLNNKKGWVDIVYLDDDLRITKTDSGLDFVHIREEEP
mmetsp:Transcript_40012/g.127962  ORF Transcript_40012/g.127962 Transcript_40012/m.127962 type:complete len:211 (-) Transcript_40012:27-659(-)